ncbi:MAG: hypothetical protein ABW215_02940 [Kibdelosporangium sp.]
MRAPLLAGDGPLARVKPLIVFVVVIGLFAAGVIVGGALGALLLGVLAAGVATLLTVTWRVLTPTDRVMRVAVLALLIGVALLQLR